MFLRIFSCLLFETDFFVSFFFLKLTFLCLPDFIWNSYLLWPWRGVHVWGHPCQTVCTHWLWRGTAFDVGTVTSFLRVCWRLSPWWLVRLEMGELDLLRNEAGLRLCSVGITALSGVRLVPKLLERKPWMSDSSRCFPFNCVFFLLPTLGLLPRREGALKPVAFVFLQRSDFCQSRSLWFHPDAAHDRVFPPVVAAPDLVLGSGLEWVELDGAFPRLRWGSIVGWQQFELMPCLGASQHSSQVECSLPQLFCLSQQFSKLSREVWEHVPNFTTLGAEEL